MFGTVYALNPIFASKKHAATLYHNLGLHRVPESSALTLGMTNTDLERIPLESGALCDVRLYNRYLPPEISIRVPKNSKSKSAYRESRVA